MPVVPIDTDQIVITASRVPEQEADSAASVTIIDAKLLERLDEPLARNLMRLVPSASVSNSGPAGSLTDVRIRGAEANHTLLFIDGIRANDPATGDQPRFDLLNADIVSRIEVVRGPQSALWGSDAIGGVVAVNGLAGVERLRRVRGRRLLRLSASRGFRFRIFRKGKHCRRRGAGSERQGSTAVAGDGDKDGYRNLSGRIRGNWRISPNIELGAAGFAINARSQFDGFNSAPPFEHTDTRDSSRNRLAAARLWAQAGEEGESWSGRVGASLLGSSNRNYLAEEQVNRTSGKRRHLRRPSPAPFRYRRHPKRR